MSSPNVLCCIAHRCDLSYNPRMSSGAWELVFMMLILKIPIAYLALVVWYAIRAEPEPGVDPNEYSVWRPWQKPDGPRPRRGGPHGMRDGARASRVRRDRVAP
jgi:hypothetical protein